MFSIIYMIRIRFFRAGRIYSETFFGRTVIQTLAIGTSFSMLEANPIVRAYWKMGQRLEDGANEAIASRASFLR